MRIAAVIPTRDRNDRVRKAVRSVLEQVRPVDELIVVDDGSSDGTVEAVEREFGDSVRILQSNGRGVSAARNLGVAAASASWIAFLDSDDLWLPEKLERQESAWREADEHRIVHSDEIWIRDGVRVNPRKRHAKRGGRIFLDCLPLCVISPSSVLLERRLFEEVGRFDESLPACEDYDLWLRICASEPVLFVDEPLVVKHGGHDDQLSRTVPALDRHRIEALRRLRGNPRLSELESRALERELARKVGVYASGARRRGRVEEAERCEALVAQVAADA